MGGQKERLKARNENIRSQFQSYSDNHAKWRVDAIIEKVAKEFYLAPRTIEAILPGEGIYSE